jgi:hypothetical protein
MQTEQFSEPYLKQREKEFSLRIERETAATAGSGISA